MQQTEPPPISASKRADKQFGQRVREARERLDLSQRALAEKLKAAGYPLDGSTVTRIEKGERSVKIVEAQAIAKALLTTVGSLLGEKPAPDLSVLRNRANVEMHNARSSMVEMLTDMAVIQQMLLLDPNLLKTSFANETDPPQTAEEYLPWVRDRMSNLTRGWDSAPAATDEDARLMRKIATSLAGHIVSVNVPFFVELFDDEDKENELDS